MQVILSNGLVLVHFVLLIDERSGQKKEGKYHSFYLKQRAVFRLIEELVTPEVSFFISLYFLYHEMTESFDCMSFR